MAVVMMMQCVPTFSVGYFRDRNDSVNGDNPKSAFGKCSSNVPQTEINNKNINNNNNNISNNANLSYTIDKGCCNVVVGCNRNENKSYLCKYIYVNGQKKLKLLFDKCKCYKTVNITVSRMSYAFGGQPLGLLNVLVVLSLLLGLTAAAGSNDRITGRLTDDLLNHGTYGVTEEFSKYTIIQPTIQHSRYKRDLKSTLSENGLHTKRITMKYEYEGKDVIIDLNLNENLTPAGHFLRYQTPNGDKVVQNLTKTDLDLCHYQGTIRNNDKSRVALSTCDGVRGVVFDGSETFYIHNKPNCTLGSDHFLYRHSDMTQTARCGYEGGINKTHDIDFFKTSEFNKLPRFKRSSAPETIIRGPYNANKHSSFVELVLVIDNKIYKAMGENLKRVHNHCIDIANIINALYVPLNIFIALVGVVVWNENNEIELSSDGDKTLKNFLQYRRKVLLKDHPNDNAQLLTKEQFEGGVVGKALKGPICTYEFSGGVSMDHSQIVSVVATTVAHEMGHNFGMEHDDKDCKCVDERCIMSSSSSSVAPLHWSSCSVDQLNLAFHQGMNYCLRNKPTKIFDSPQCGNGFVEPGEQCDCGLPDFCENTCCDPHTCMLHTNASCATGACCDLSTCHPRTAGTICRSSAGECDLPEYCTGESEYCPEDYFKRDTEECGGGKAFCYEGMCRSRDDQCKILWGPSGRSSDPCYEKNLNGTRHGNCGYDRLANIYMNCSKEDVFCGMLQCRHLNEKLEFGMESVAVLSHSYIPYDGNIIPCRTAIVDLGLQSIDPGLVPDGAKCAEGKMCIHQKCMSLDVVRGNGMAPACPENCSGHGICNNKGFCHCEIGFGSPLCNTPGPGGSEISGPATNPNDGTGVVRVMYVFFLGVVPFVSLVLFFIYYWRQNRPQFLRKAPNVFKSTTAIKKSPQRGAGGGSSSPSTQAVSTPSSTDDMNSSLLKSGDNADPSMLNNNMFGHFKGFTLKPLPITRTPTVGATNVAFVHPVSKSIDQTTISNGVPSRMAPPVPKPPNLMRKQSQIKPIEPTIHQMQSEKAEAPALPPLNPGTTARPIISSPILEASTCTAKELISPLRHNAEKFITDKIPQRPAPSVPVVKFEQPVAQNVDQKSSGNKEKDSAIKRIASFLKKDEKPGHHTLPRNLTKSKPTIDREKLKSIEISHPLPVEIVDQQKDIDEEKDHRNQVVRTQSMRDSSATVVKRVPNIQTFGSMRHTPNKARPGSMVGSRPKSPPPRPPAPPAITNLKIPGVPGYQNPPSPKKVIAHENDYDDCEAVEAPIAVISEDISPTSSDNIYSVIDEYDRPPPAILPPENADNSMGLLGEIVNEIENRNFDSIYSASTLSRKKDNSESAYVNTNTESQEYSDNDYMNMKSNSSTTSSGYLKPSAINTPIARVAPVKLSESLSKPISNNLSSFKRNGGEDPSKSDKPTFSSFPRPSDVKSAENDKSKTTTKPVNKYLNNKTTPPVNTTAGTGISTKTATVSKPSSPLANRKTPFNRTKTPPSLTSNSIRTRSPSPAKPVTISQKLTKPTPLTKANGPDLVNNLVSNKSKNPDVVSNAQRPKPLAKPNLTSSSTGDTNKLTDKPKWQSTAKNAQTESSNGSSNGNNSNNSKLSGNVSGANKYGAQRPGFGKNSNVASLQKRFEAK